MKEIDIIEEEITRVNKHPGNINSNLNGNLASKENLEEVVSNASNISSEFDVALNGICIVINKIDSFVKSVANNKGKINNNSIKKLDSKQAENLYEYIIEKKHDVYNSEPVHPFEQRENNTVNCNFIV